MGNEPSQEITTQLQSDRSLSLESANQSETFTSQKFGHKTITVRNSQELQIIKKNFQFRLKYRQYLAHLYGFEIGDNKSEQTLQKMPCKSLFSSIKVTFHYEKVTLKFSDLYNVSIKEGAKLLQHCLKGFSVLLDNFGYFTPESRQIFKQGQKWVVWVSDNIFSIKDQIEDKNQDNSKIRCKFWQKIIHLFDVLRDQQNPGFSYSTYIYGFCVQNQPYKVLQFQQIIEKLRQISEISKERRNFRGLLRKSSVNSSSTIRKEECKVNLSLDQNRNDDTLSKFNKSKTQFPQKIKTKQYAVKLPKKNLQFPNNQIIKANQSEKNIPIQKDQYCQKQNFVNFKKVSSKLLKIVNNNQIKEPKQNKQSRHVKNVSSISTLTNCTGCANEVAPWKLFGNPHETDKSFMKKQRAMTYDYSNTANFNQQIAKLQPRKITQNSQGNSDYSEKDNEKYDEQKVSVSSKEQKDEVIMFGANQFPQDDQSIKAPSISNNTKNHGKQTMKNIQEYINLTFKSQHKRSLTDQVQIDGKNKQIKLCHSQQFDSEFFSSCSKRQIPTSSKFVINALDSAKILKKQMNSEVNISIGNTSIRNSEKQIRKVKISDEKDNVRIFKDSILEHNEVEDSSFGPKEASIARLAAFKSEGGLKTLLGTKMDTLKSIKQIDVDVPIDEQILYDLNKMYPRHHFSKSTKITN